MSWNTRRPPTLLFALLLAGCDLAAGIHNGPPGDASNAVADQVLLVGTTSSGRTDLYLAGTRAEGSLKNLTTAVGALNDGMGITTTSDGSLFPVPSEDGQHVLFLLEVPGADAPRQLVELTTLTLAEQPLGEAPAGLRRAFYDRSGTRVLLDVRDPETGQAKLMRWTDSGPLNLNPTDESLTFDGFFPDEDRLLVRVGAGAERQMAVLDLRDASVTRFGSPEGLDIGAPRISPDGERIVFHGRAQPDACYELFAMDVETASDSLNSPEPLGAAQGVWASVYGQGAPGDHSPGEDAAPDASPETGGPAAGAATTQCVSVSEPLWAPDGTDRIAFMATTDPTSGRADAFTLDPDGTITALTTQLEEDGPGVTSPPRWSPDGAALLFSFTWTQAEGQPTQVDLYLAEDGGASRLLTEGYDGVPSLAHWDAEGDHLLFWARGSNGESTSSDAVVVDLSDGHIEVITAGEGLHVAYPLWLDANTLLY